MAGSPNANRTVLTNFATQAAPLVLSAATDAEREDLDFLAAPFIVRKILYQVEVAVTGTASEVTATWRPTPGSATDARTIAIFAVPVSAIDEVGVVDLNENPKAEVVVGAGGPSSTFGIAGSNRNEGVAIEDMINGFGGSVHMVSDAGATAGSVKVWLEVEMLSLENDDNQTNERTNVTPTQVGDVA